MQINPYDIRVDTFNTGNMWFPKHNGVTITHLPTDTVVKYSAERSVWANRTKAFEILLATLGSPNQLELF